MTFLRVRTCTNGRAVPAEIVRRALAGLSEAGVRDRMLGAGSFGEVWLAKLNGTPVAVKRLHRNRLDEANLTAFRSEFELQLTLGGENASFPLPVYVQCPDGLVPSCDADPAVYPLAVGDPCLADGVCWRRWCAEKPSVCTREGCCRRCEGGHWEQWEEDSSGD